MYSVTVTDDNGCQDSNFVVIGEPGPIVTSMTSADESAPGASDGTATVSATGGTPGYTYFWSTGASGATLSGLGPGTYYVTVADIYGCTAVDTAIINVITGVDYVQGEPWFNLFPNPTKGQVFVDYVIPDPGSLDFRVYNAVGQMVYDKNVIVAFEGRIEFDLEVLSKGVYTVEMRAGSKRKFEKIVVLD